MDTHTGLEQRTGYTDTRAGLDERKSYLKLVAAIVDGLRVEAGPMVDAEAISLFRILSHKLRSTAAIRG